MMLEGKNVNLRVMEKEDIQLYTEWCNDWEFKGEYLTPWQASVTERARSLEKESGIDSSELKIFIVEKKNGSKIGWVLYYIMEHPGWNHLDIAAAIIPKERNKGYATEAIKILVDYLFLEINTQRVESTAFLGNIAGQRILEKAGFKKEAMIRKAAFMRGKLRDEYLYSILREEWKEPKILKKPK